MQICGDMATDMENRRVDMLPWYKSLAFWKALSWLLAGVDALLVYYGVLPEVYLWSAGAILSAILSVLNALQIVPELRSRGLI